MLTWLNYLQKNKVISALDFSFAEYIGRLEKEAIAQEQEASPQLIESMMLLAALVSHELSQGHICVDLKTRKNLPVFYLKESLNTVPVPDLVMQFQADPTLFMHKLSLAQTLLMVNRDSALNSIAPLVFDQGRVYLYRYWLDEKKLATRLTQMSQHILPVSPQTNVTLNALFAESGSHHEINWQKIAAAVALTRQLAVISGGPGTGKTTVVCKILAALILQAQNTKTQLTLRLAAPTGKAAARLSESIGKTVRALNIVPEIKQAIPTQAQTLHRLLGARIDRKAFRYNLQNPLHLDVLILDEASMVDLPLMTRLVEALPCDARLILLGDRNQLSSVEAGAVLGDICQYIECGYSQLQADLLSQLTGFDLSAFVTLSAPINDSLCLLRHSYRFDEHSGIGQLATAVNQGNFNRVLQVQAQGFVDIAYHELDEQSYLDFINMAAASYRPYLQAIDGPINNQKVSDIIALFAQAQVLCAVREGPFGVEGLNHQIRMRLIKSGLLPKTDLTWYVGRPIMVTQNEVNLDLYNGDIGICLYDPQLEKLKVYFILPDGSIRSVLPSRLPEHQSVFAMTIHKSQGSEFSHTMMILPDTPTPVITRELIYTGITRAKDKLDLYAPKAILRQGIEHKTQRASGLSARLI